MTNCDPVLASDATKEGSRQLERDCISGDFAQDRKRAQAELARSMNDKHRARFATALGLWLVVISGAMIMLVFDVVKFALVILSRSFMQNHWR